MSKEVRNKINNSLEIVKNNIDNSNELLDLIVKNNLDYVEKLNFHLISFDNQPILRNKLLRVIQTLKALNNGIINSKLQYHNINENVVVNKVISENEETK